MTIINDIYKEFENVGKFILFYIVKKLNINLYAL